MVKGLVLSLLLATALVTGAFAQSPVVHPNPHQRAIPAARGLSTPVDPDDPGCGLILDYYRGLNDALMGADAFFAFMGDVTIDYGDLSKAEADEIIASGETLVENLKALQVPGVYARGNEGIVNLMQFDVDVVIFYAIDSSRVPNVNAYDDALMMTYEAEISIAVACPNEVAEIGGYVMYDPADLKQDLGLE